MIQTFTFFTDNSAKPSKPVIKTGSQSDKEPSEQVLQNILNYSKNLEVKDSQIFDKVSILKS